MTQESLYTATPLTPEQTIKWQEHWDATRPQREIEAKLSREGYRGPGPKDGIRIEIDGTVTISG